MEVTVIPIVIGALGTIPKRLIKGLEDLKWEDEYRDHSHYSLIRISQNTEKSPGDLWTLAVIQTQVEEPQLTLEWKICIIVIITTMTEKWENCGTWGWRWYRLSLEHLRWSPKICKKDWKNWKWEEASKPPWPNIVILLEYWEESRRHVVTCCHSDSSERPLPNATLKDSQGVRSSLIIRRTNLKAKIDNPHTSKHRLCDDRDKTIT